MKDKKTLRTGFTTGTCAAAAAKGAVATFLGARPKVMEVTLPSGTTASISLNDRWTKNGTTYCTVVKDAGDDPDVTNGALIGAEVSLVRSTIITSAQKVPIVLSGGEGIGVVTKPGLPVKKGEPAINPVPRKMITNAIRETLSHDRKMSASLSRVEVVIFVPQGKAIAKKTFNPKLGILGGISILGTTGIVTPFSHHAYRETIRCALHIAKATKCKEVVLSTGGSSERLAKEYFPPKQEESFIQMGDWVGFALAQAVRIGFRSITVAGFMGKLSKIAAGCTYTHARHFPMDVKFLVSLGKRAGVRPKVLEEISQSITTRGMITILLKHREYGMVDAVCSQAISKLIQWCKKPCSVFLVLFSSEGEVLWYGGKEGKIGGIH